MSYSGRLGSGGYASRGPHPDSGTKAFPTWRLVSLWIAVFLWLVFMIAALSSPSILNDVWAWASGLPIQWQMILWVMGLPWMLGLAFLQADLPAYAQVLLIAGTAAISIWTFAPTRSS